MVSAIHTERRKTRSGEREVKQPVCAIIKEETSGAI
jgi:hypothetical protein